MNFVYAFDENYNIQGFVAIKSLVDKVDRKINIHILHKNPDTFNEFQNELTNHKNINTINIHKFISKDLNFPNIENRHVSEATYYRLYINKYLSENLDNVIYLDSDILCLNNPLPYLNLAIQEMNKKDKLLCARTEHIKNKNNEYIFERLQLESSKYFNGGVLVINYKKWLKENVFKNLQEKVANNDIDLLWWDQDILNQVLDGRYIDLNYFANYKLSLDWKIDETYLLNEVIFLHYQGKLKPWYIVGLLQHHAKLYQDIFFETKYSNKKYHLIKENSIYDLIQLFKSIFNLKLFKLKNPILVFFKVIKNIFNG